MVEKQTYLVIIIERSERLPYPMRTVMIYPLTI